MREKSMLIIALIISVIMIPVGSSAESHFFAVVENTVREIIDCSDKQFINTSAVNADSQFCSIFIDLTEGNYSIVAVDNDRAMLVYPFEYEELASCTVGLLLFFEDIEEQILDGRSLEYNLKFSESETLVITRKNLKDFLSFLFDLDEEGGNTSTPAYSSTIPFENLEFMDFLYEEYSIGGSAQISGTVKNHNNYPVFGYFHILFYKNNKLVHTNLVSLPTIPAGGTGVWSDLIYAVDYDRIEYADSTVTRK